MSRLPQNLALDLDDNLVGELQTRFLADLFHLLGVDAWLEQRFRDADRSQIVFDVQIFDAERRDGGSFRLIYVSTLAPETHPLADATGHGPALLTVEAGAQLNSGYTAAGRRVSLSWGWSFYTFSQLNANGRTILQRSIEWCAGAVIAPVPAPVLTSGNYVPIAPGRTDRL